MEVLSVPTLTLLGEEGKQLLGEEVYSLAVLPHDEQVSDLVQQVEVDRLPPGSGENIQVLF
tara:strand:- start:1136 stop:1318 length:183 start_codon:yes stop_codon:yes gene_type:complete